MNQLGFTILYIALLTLEFLTVFTLTSLNINSVIKNRESIPLLFQSLISKESYSKSIKYTLRKEHFSILRLIFSTLFSVIILFSGFLGKIESVLSSYISNSTIYGILFIGIITFILSISEIPFSIYSTFVIEEEFGFNKMSIKSYISDTIKQTVLTVFLGGIILFALFMFIEKTGSIWWLLASTFFILFQLLLVVIYPTFIAPIFNKFTPLEDGELKTELEKMATEAKFSLTGIFVMDGSKRSGHSNAYFTGIGKTKRIVLYDTLIENLTVQELCGVLAHEIGHWKMGHITKKITLTFLTIPVTFFIISLLIGFQPLFTTFGLQPGTYYGLITLIMMISSSFTFFLTPLSNKLSRKHEFEADDFAKKIRGESDSLINALLKLSKDNLSNLTPDIYYSTYYYSHPPVSERVKKLSEN